MYASVVSRETVIIALMNVAFDDLDIKSGIILKAYVQASVTEKVWTTLGPKFCNDAIKTAVIVRALYGLQSSRAAFRSYLTRCMESWDYQFCEADPDLWLISEIKPEDGIKY